MFVIVLGSASSCEGQQAKITVEGPTTSGVSRTFTVDIWIRDLPSPMIEANIRVEWDTSLMEVVDIDTSVDENGWTFIDGILGEYFYFLRAQGPPFSEDDSWIRITFHCLGPGTSEIRIEESSLEGSTASISWTKVDLEVTQIEPSPVGGISTSINKLEILTPYIALAGLIIAVSTVYITKRHKD